MRKNNVIHYRNWCMKRLKEIQDEEEEFHKAEDTIKGNMYGDALQELYLNEEYYKGQINACNFILNNC